MRVIRGDAINPRREIGLRRELLQFLISAQKCLLHNFFGVVMISGQAVRQPKNRGAVPLHQNAISIAIARKRALDGDGVGFPNALDAIPSFSSLDRFSAPRLGRPWPFFASSAGARSNASAGSYAVQAGRTQV